MHSIARFERNEYMKLNSVQSTFLFVISKGNHRVYVEAQQTEHYNVVSYKLVSWLLSGVTF